MKNKGFTLIELLAVIVILAIIALIAVPIILNVIDSSKNSANQRSKELYLDAVEQAIARKNLTGEYNPTNCEVMDENGTLKCWDGEKELDPLTVEVNGTKPDKRGKIIFEKGKVKSDTLVFGEGTKEEAGKICTLASDSEKQGYEIGAKYTCSLDEKRTFYVLENNLESDTITLLMDRNLGDTVAWISQSDWEAAGGIVTDEMKNDGGYCQWAGICATNEYGPITANKYLASLTTNWGVEVGIPSKEQMEGVGCTRSSKSCPTWAYDYIDRTSNPNIYGYWTSTGDSSNSSMASMASIVDYNGRLDENNVYYGSSSFFCLRPVITVLKSSLN